MLQSSFTLAALLLLVSAAAVTDSRSGTIPNWLTLPVLPLAPLVAGFLQGPMSLITALLGILVCGGIPYLFFRAGALGGGDVKLFAAIGACVGVQRGLEIQLYSMGLLLVAATLRLTWRGELWKVLASSVRIVLRVLLPRSRRPLPAPDQMLQMRMGVPIWLATVLLSASRLWAAWGWS